MRFDLHTHSNHSDGALAPADVVRRAAEAGLDGIALTDHDSTSGIDEARAAGEAIGVEVLTGCEISSVWENVGIHMLAYFFDPANARLVEELRWIRDDRVVRAEKMVEKLAEMGHPVTMEQVRRIAGGAAIGRPHVAAALVEAGVVANTPDAFTPELIGDGAPAYVQKKVTTPHETVKFIREAGGVAVVAHAIWIDSEGLSSQSLIEDLAAVGLGGIEVDHPDHDGPARLRFGALADRLGLVRTASSDFHGNQHGGIIGENAASEDVVAELRKRAVAVRA
jgi:predicted metal-dependent phosphoesterase TrpH